MKLLHTSDWHLGARLGRLDRAPDHEAALEGLLAVAESERPDLILHTGDLFDAARPPYDALRMGIRALGRLSALAPTVVLAGNHDSKELFRALDDLASAGEPRRLWFLSEPQVQSLGDAHVACVPFIPPGAVARYATDDPATFAGSYADGIRSLNANLLKRARKAAGSRGVVIYAAHLHVHGARPGKSERRITVGDDYATHPAGLDKALYAAFGHIHDPQLLPGGIARGRYAGSLIPLDFGEVEQTKEAVVVEIGHDVQVKTRDLPGGRPLVEFAGGLDEFERRARTGRFEGAILKARVASDDPVPDLADRLREWSPGCAVFDLANPVKNQTAKAVEGAGEGSEPSLEALFAEWWGTRPKGGHRDVPALFSEALGAADFDLEALRSRTDEALEALKCDR